MKTMINLWCGWDFGQDYYIFTDENKAKAYLAKAMNDQLDELGFNNIQEVFDEGLAGYEVVTVDP